MDLHIDITVANASMEIESLLNQSATGAVSPILPSETLSEPPIPPSKSTKKPPASKKRKRSLSDVIAEIPCVKDVKFDPLRVPHISTQLRLPVGIDTENAYAVFSLFWPESMWTTITTNTNLYAVQKRLHTVKERDYPWRNVCKAEIKIFFGVLLYMGVHKDYEEAQFWRQNIEKGPIHTCAL